MSDAVLATEGYADILDALTADLVVRVHLYTNDPDLSAPFVLADFVAPVYEGYAPRGVARWTPAAMAAGRAYSLGDPQTFTFATGAAPAPIRGYYATMGAAPRVLWAWRRPGDPFALGPANLQLTVTVRITFPPAPE